MAGQSKLGFSHTRNVTRESQTIQQRFSLTTPDGQHATVHLGVQIVIEEGGTRREQTTQGDVCTWTVKMLRILLSQVAPPSKTQSLAVSCWHRTERPSLFWWIRQFLADLHCQLRPDFQGLVEACCVHVTFPSRHVTAESIRNSLRLPQETTTLFVLPHAGTVVSWSAPLLDGVTVCKWLAAVSRLALHQLRIVLTAASCSTRDRSSQRQLQVAQSELGITHLAAADPGEARPLGETTQCTILEAFPCLDCSHPHVSLQRLSLRQSMTLTLPPQSAPEDCSAGERDGGSSSGHQEECPLQREPDSPTELQGHAPTTGEIKAAAATEHSKSSQRASDLQVDESKDLPANECKRVEAASVDILEAVFRKLCSENTATTKVRNATANSNSATIETSTTTREVSSTTTVARLGRNGITSSNRTCGSVFSSSYPMAGQQEQGMSLHLLFLHLCLEVGLSCWQVNIVSATAGSPLLLLNRIVRNALDGFFGRGRVLQLRGMVGRLTASVMELTASGMPGNQRQITMKTCMLKCSLFQPSRLHCRNQPDYAAVECVLIAGVQTFMPQNQRFHMPGMSAALQRRFSVLCQLNPERRMQHGWSETSGDFCGTFTAIVSNSGAPARMVEESQDFAFQQILPDQVNIDLQRACFAGYEWTGGDICQTLSLALCGLQSNYAMAPVPDAINPSGARKILLPLASSNRLIGPPSAQSRSEVRTPPPVQGSVGSLIPESASGILEHAAVVSSHMSIPRINHEQGLSPESVLNHPGRLRQSHEQSLSPENAVRYQDGHEDFPEADFSTTKKHRSPNRTKTIVNTEVGRENDMSLLKDAQKKGGISISKKQDLATVRRLKGSEESSLPGADPSTGSNKQWDPDVQGRIASPDVSLAQSARAEGTREAGARRGKKTHAQMPKLTPETRADLKSRIGMPAAYQPLREVRGIVLPRTVSNDRAEPPATMEIGQGETALLPASEDIGLTMASPIDEIIHTPAATRRENVPGTVVQQTTGYGQERGSLDAHTVRQPDANGHGNARPTAQESGDDTRSVEDGCDDPPQGETCTEISLASRPATLPAPSARETEPSAQQQGRRPNWRPPLRRLQTDHDVMINTLIRAAVRELFHLRTQAFLELLVRIHLTRLLNLCRVQQNQFIGQEEIRQDDVAPRREEIAIGNGPFTFSMTPSDRDHTDGCCYSLRNPATGIRSFAEQDGDHNHRRRVHRACIVPSNAHAFQDSSRIFEADAESRNIQYVDLHDPQQRPPRDDPSLGDP